MKWILPIASSLVLVTLSVAQDKRIPQPYVTDVLDARFVTVVPYSDSGPASDPQENQRARLDTQNALRQWGKYQVTQDASAADLIIVVRKGRSRSTTIGGTPPVVLYPNDSGVTIGARRGQTDPLSRTDPRQSQGQAGWGQEAGSPDDRLEVYLGGNPRIDDASRTETPYPLDEPPIWSYTAEDGLKPPKMDAVAAFRHAVEAAQKKKP